MLTRQRRARKGVWSAPVAGFVAGAGLLAAGLRWAASARTTAVHGQAEVSGLERAFAGLLAAAADAAGIATLGCLYAAVLLAGSAPSTGRGLVSPVAWRLQRTAGALAAGWALLAVAQIPLGVARLIREPLRVAWNATYLYDYLSVFAPGRLQLAAAALVPLTAAAARAGLRQSTAIATLTLAAAALVAQALAGAQFQPSSVLVEAALAVHVVAVAGWAGGMLAVVTMARLPARVVSRMLRRHALWAAGWVGLAGTSGALLAHADLTTARDLVTTLAGRLIAAKIGLYLAALGVGWAIRQRIRDRAATPARRSPRRLLLTEITLFAAAIGVAAALGLS